MKSILRFFVYILLIGLAFVSCSKNSPANNTRNIYPSPVPRQAQPLSSAPLFNNSLRGQEFIFYDLVWNYDVDGAANLYIGIENRPDLFSQDWAIEVSLKPEDNNNWIAAEKFHYPNSPGYVYSIYSNGLFIFHSPHIFPWSANNQLAGTKVSVKVKFI